MMTMRDLELMQISSLLDSNPVEDIFFLEACLYRSMSKKGLMLKYRKLNVKVFKNKYKKCFEIAVRNFLSVY